MRHFLQYWKNYDPAAELGYPLRFSASKQFRPRRVGRGDTLWIVALRDRRLTLLGRFKVETLVNRAEARNRFGSDVYVASWYALPEHGEEPTIVEVDIQKHARDLRFNGKSPTLRLGDIDVTDGKQLQSIRALTNESVHMLSLLLGVSFSDSGALGSPAERRNPTWSRDELILALDLYFKHPPLTISKEHRAVVELSSILNAIGAKLRRIENGKFRNENGVYMKLCNFLRFDPSYPGSGLKGGGKLEEEVWRLYSDDRPELGRIAASIVTFADEEESVFPADTDDPEADEFPEGAILYRAHRRRERNRQLVARAKAAAKKRSPELACEICSFSFVRRYGELGENFIECHHTTPVSSMKPGDKTRLEDVVLLCSNCHRMVHRRKKWLSIADMHLILKP